MKNSKKKVINKKIKDLGMLVSVLNDIEAYRSTYLGEVDFEYFVTHYGNGYNIKVVFND